jgi:DhnA family fructose-bisphosphate aldolase class Ia
MSSKTHRMHRIFGPDGHTLIVAMDHAGFMGPVPGLIDCVSTVRSVVAGGADAVMTTLGTAHRILECLQGRGLVLSVDLHAPDPAAVVENAIALGADSLKTLAYPLGDEAAGLRNVGRYGVLCEKWGLPFQAEMIPFSFAATDKHTPENIATAARIGAELGADYVKVPYTGDPDSFRQVTEGAGVPVIILGGAKSQTPIANQVADAIRAGGAGIAFGRNIWSTSDPEAAVRSFARAIHGGAARAGSETPQTVRA